ncbi:response regulator, partial [Massilia arenosa]
PAAGGAARASGHGRAQVLPGATVLLVDDSETVLEASRALLEQLGFVVVTAASADEALALLAQQVVAPGLVLSDIVMPGTLDGIGLARAVRARWPELPVILATGFSLDEDATLGAGFAVLRKPYTLDQLRQALHTDPARPATVA